MEKIIILGFSSAYLPILSEVFNQLFNCKEFDAIKNMDVQEPSHPYQFMEYTYNHYLRDEYDLEANRDGPVYFGVLHSHIKSILFYFFKNKYGIERERYLDWVHPISSVSKNLVHENALGISSMSVVYPFCNFGFGVNLKRSSSIGEHTTLGDFVSINPGVTLSGLVTVGEGTEISTGASCVHDITIGKYCLIGSGSVITKGIPDGVAAYGNPCKVMRKIERWEK